MNDDDTADGRAQNAPRGTATLDGGARRYSDGKGRNRHRGQGAAQEEFRSYFGRAVLKTPVWEWKVPAYLFTGGLSAGSAMLAAGADLTARPALRRATRVGGFAALAASMYLLVADLGRPERFHHMLRVAKPTSPMSVGTWVLVAYSPGSGLAAASEFVPASLRHTTAGRLLAASGRPAGLSAALIAPAVASYTAALLSQSASPAWHEAHPYLPFVFTGSAAASAAGLGMALSPPHESAPARRLAVYGACVELVGSHLMESKLGFVEEAYTTGKAGRLRRASGYLTAGGLAGTVLLAKRGRVPAVVCGLALMAGSLLQRFGVFEAGVESARDPKYVTVPQRERANRHEAALRRDGSAVAEA
jgi:formate-dependent nitrite reductase membrane component NrfD